MKPSTKERIYLAANNQKRCGKCREIKSLNDFSKNPKTCDGLMYKCKSCARIDDKIRYQNNKDKILQQSKDRYKKQSEIMYNANIQNTGDCGKNYILYRIIFKHKILEIKFLKVGITKLSIDKRYASGYSEWEYEVIDLEHGSKKEILSKEQLLLRKLRDAGASYHLPEGVEFAGKTECFDLYKYSCIREV